MLPCQRHIARYLPPSFKSNDQCTQALIFKLLLTHATQQHFLIFVDVELPKLFFADLLDRPINNLKIKEKKKLVTLAAAPANSRQRKGWYQDEANCPQWWASEGLPWVSQNHQKGANQCFFSVSQLNQLIVSYKHSLANQVGTQLLFNLHFLTNIARHNQSFILLCKQHFMLYLSQQIGLQNVVRLLTTLK